MYLILITIFAKQRFFGVKRKNRRFTTDNKSNLLNFHYSKSSFERCHFIPFLGLTVGKPLITLVGDKETYKSDQKNHGKQINVATNENIVNETSSVGEYEDASSNYKVNSESSFASNDVYDKNNGGVALNDDVISPSRLAERLYSQLESDDAKLSGFQLEKDPSGGEVLIGPMSRAVSDMVYQKNSQNASSVEDEKLTTFKGSERLKSSRLENQSSKDPLAKVSYVLNHKGEDLYHSLPSSNDTTSNGQRNIENNANVVQGKNDSSNIDVKEVNTSSMVSNSEASHDLGAFSKSDFVKSQNSNGMNRSWNETIDKSKPNIDHDMGHEVFNQSAPSAQNSNISSDTLNIQLPELVKSVVERLGNQGTMYVSLELAKHPMMKDIWASSIARALLMESNKISQLDSGKKVGITSDSSRIADLSTDLSKVSAHESQRPKEGNQSASSPLTTVQMNEPAQTIKEKVKGHSLSELTIGNADNSAPLHKMKETANAVGESNSTPTSHMIESSQAGQDHEKNNRTQGVHQGPLKKPMTQAAPKINSKVQEKNHYDLLPKTAGRIAAGQNTKTSEQETYNRKQVLTPLISGFISNKEIPTWFGGSDKDEPSIYYRPVVTLSSDGLVSNTANQPTQLPGAQGDQKEDLPKSTNAMVSSANSNRAIDAPFLYSKFTSLDPDETKYVQLNLMSDPVAKESFTDVNSPFSSQEQLQDEDTKEASFLEHQINDAGRLVQEIFPSLNSTAPKQNTGQFFGNPLAQANSEELYTRDNHFLNVKKRKNEQLMASVVNEDQKFSSDPAFNQPQSQDKQQKFYPDATQKSYLVPPSLYKVPGHQDGTGTQAGVGQIFSSPKTASDISSVDLAPLSSLVGLQGAFNLIKPKTLNYQSENIENGRKLDIRGDGVSQFGVNPFPASLARPQKKHLIHMSKRKHRKKFIRKENVNSSSSTTLSTTSSPMHVKTSYKHASNGIKPTKSRNQPGTRDSEISPSSVIFGLTAKEMKELETHLAHTPHIVGGPEENSGVQGASPTTKGYYNTVTDEEQEKSMDSTKNLVQKSLKQQNLTRKEVKHSLSYKKKAHTIKHATHFSKRLHKKFDNYRNKKRDLESWESSTDVLNSDLDQIRGLNPKAQEDISKVILKDYDGHQRNIKDIEAFPFDEHDPGYSFERSLKAPGRRNLRRVKISKHFGRNSQDRGQLYSEDVVERNSAEVKHGVKGLHKETEINTPLVIRGNKIFNGDVIPLDDVKNEFTQGLLRETLGKESEGVLKHANAISKHDIDRIKSMFQSAGDEIGMKRDSKRTFKVAKQGHLKVNKIAKLLQPNKRRSKSRKHAARRDATDWATEFNDGTFRSPDFERQLSRALKQESEHDLNYVNRLESLDKSGLRKGADHVDPKSNPRRGNAENAFQEENIRESTNNSHWDDLMNTQKKLKAFLQNSNRNGKGLAHEEHELGGKREWTNSEIRGSVFRDLTPEGKVLSDDYKDLGTFGSDAQAQLASVLQFANSDDQRDLKELEKIDKVDEKDVESLFKPSAEAFKRSILDKLAGNKEGTVETIADIFDPGSEGKEINNVVSSDEGKFNQL